MGELIAVASGKGGTGKTSVTAGVANTLASMGKRVLCIDCDVGLRNLDISLGLSDLCPLTFLDVTVGGYPVSEATVHPKFPTLHFLTAPMNCAPESIDLAPLGAFLTDARHRYDYIFLDAPAGVDAGFRLAAKAADRCIVVTGAGPAAVRDASRVGDLLELMGKSGTRLVVNRIDRDMLSTVRVTIDDVMDIAGLPLIGVVLEDANVTLAAAFGKPVLQYAKRCEAAKAFKRIAKRVQGIATPIKLR